MAVTSYTAVERLVTGTWSKCYTDLDGQCYEVPPKSTGMILYNEEHEACATSWILVPGFNLLPKGLLVVVYFLLFMWIFQGVTICSDMFVGGIEVIISMKKKVKVKDPNTGETTVVEKPAWNWVIANLSLMAVGTSGPEIILALVETLMTLGQKPGELGPACIVGSASYNFFVISAVCTVSLAYGETKRIEQFRVFACTLIWSVWAYIWMYLVYEIISPNEIEVWEAFLTLAFFPMLLLMAWVLDTQPWCRGSQVAVVPVKDDEMGSGILGPLALNSPNPAEKKRHSILYYRMLAMRQMAGETRTQEMIEMAGGDVMAHGVDSLQTFSARLTYQHTRELEAPPDATKLAFTSVHYSVLESQGTAKVIVRRYDGDVDTKCSVRYHTEDGTAIAGIDYLATEGVISFLPGETEHEISITIIDDDMAEPDVTLSVVLSDVLGDNIYIVQDSVSITIVDDDDGGVITFELPTYEVGRTESYVDVPVVRRHGVSGAVTVDYETKDGTGLAGTHYTTVVGTLSLPKGEARMCIRVPILQPDAIAQHSTFKLSLSNPLGGAVLGSRTECRVLITAVDKKAKRQFSAARFKDKAGSGKGDVQGSEGDEDEDEEPFDLWADWKAQYVEAIFPTLEEDSGVIWQMALHYVSITWKLILAAIPPPGWKNGFPCFFASLGFLALQLTLLKEAVELWGCSVGLSDLMVGITIVALGTSLPDTFASRMAAIHDDTADAAIGNITGSNSVNVFLGLGLPWVIASVYYKAKGEKYHVEPGPLGFSVVLHCCLSVGGLAIMMFCRWKGGELGGSKISQWTQFATYMSMWVLFLVLVGVLDYGHITSTV